MLWWKSVCVHTPVHLSVFLSLSICLPVLLSVSQSVYGTTTLSLMQFLSNCIQNEPINVIKVSKKKRGYGKKKVKESLYG